MKDYSQYYNGPIVGMGGGVVQPAMYAPPPDDGGPLPGVPNPPPLNPPPMPTDNYGPWSPPTQLGSTVADTSSSILAGLASPGILIAGVVAFILYKVFHK